MKIISVIILAVALTSSVLGAAGCKAKQGEPPAAKETGEEALAPMTEETVGGQGYELTVVDTIPPTAAPEVQAKAQASGVKEASRDRDIQTALKKAGFYAGAIDGKIGPRTKKAIEEFQKSKGLVVDGKVGPRTRAELEKYLAE